MIDGDSIALTQLFVNLLLNAAHALSAGQSARLDVSLLAREVAVILEDNGCGIPPDALPHIRDPFFSTKNNGTGLGLSLAERTVRAHGGSLHIASTPPTGTRVEVRLPLPIAASRTDVPAALSS
jgi:signal transduction histidine kinase